jgi:hypothetical protein
MGRSGAAGGRSRAVVLPGCFLTPRAPGRPAGGPGEKDMRSVGGMTGGRPAGGRGRGVGRGRPAGGLSSSGLVPLLSMA